MLSFLAYFKIPDEEVLRIERRALVPCYLVHTAVVSRRTFIHLPHITVKPGLFCALGIRVLQHVAGCSTSKLQPMVDEGFKRRRMLPWHMQCKSLPSVFYMQFVWHLWFGSGIIKDMSYALVHVSRAGLSIRDLMEQAGARGVQYEDFVPARNKHIRKSFQKTFRIDVDKN